MEGQPSGQEFASSFFMDAGIPVGPSNKYAAVFSENRMRMEMLQYLTKDVLHELGVVLVGDVLAILHHSKKVIGQMKGNLCSEMVSTNKVTRPTASSVAIQSFASKGNDVDTIVHENTCVKVTGKSFMDNPMSVPAGAVLPVAMTAELPKPRKTLSERFTQVEVASKKAKSTEIVVKVNRVPPTTWMTDLDNTTVRSPANTSESDNTGFRCPLCTHSFAFYDHLYRHMELCPGGSTSTTGPKVTMSALSHKEAAISNLPSPAPSSDTIADHHSGEPADRCDVITRIENANSSIADVETSCLDSFAMLENQTTSAATPVAVDYSVERNDARRSNDGDGADKRYGNHYNIKIEDERSQQDGVGLYQSGDQCERLDTPVATDHPIVTEDVTISKDSDEQGQGFVGNWKDGNHVVALQDSSCLNAAKDWNSATKQSDKSTLQVAESPACLHEHPSDSTTNHANDQCSKEKDVRQYPYACTSCDAVFSRQAKLASHNMHHHTVEDVNFEEEFNSGKPHSCTDCEKRFKCSRTLQQHIQTHAKEKLFRCPHCKKIYPSKHKFTMHVRRHTSERRYACQYCEKRFIHQSSLNGHLVTHTGERPFACPQCEKQYTSKHSLKIHARTHTGERPYACQYCEKRFIQTSHLTSHLRTHTGERPFACQYCEKCFIHQSSLNEHLVTHTGERPFACPQCEKRYSSKQSLTIHARTHTGERPYACQYCEKRFIRHYILTAHLQTHTGERPFACQYCEKRFTQRSNMTQHLRTHTG